MSDPTQTWHTHPPTHPPHTHAHTTHTRTHHTHMHVSKCTHTTTHNLHLHHPGPLHANRFLYCQAQGGNLFHTWKKRFFAIVQLSEYKFVLSHYKPKTAHPKQLVVLEGYVADYSETQVPQGVGARGGCAGWARGWCGCVYVGRCEGVVWVCACGWGMREEQCGVYHSTIAYALYT